MLGHSQGDVHPQGQRAQRSEPSGPRTLRTLVEVGLEVSGFPSRPTCTGQSIVENAVTSSEHLGLRRTSSRTPILMGFCSTLGPTLGADGHLGWVEGAQAPLKPSTGDMLPIQKQVDAACEQVPMGREGTLQLDQNGLPGDPASGITCWGSTGHHIQRNSQAIGFSNPQNPGAEAGMSAQVASQ
ncbi:hypothetical protein P7K49_027866, partial [Saguinus oedipus]